jgi:uncharacterized protein (TIGR02271 family)
MPTLQDVQSWRGRELRSNDGDKIGTISEIYLDRDSDRPEWLAVKTGMFGSRHSFVPIDAAREDGDAIAVPFDKDLVKDAPNAEADGELSSDEERSLYAHYGREYAESGGVETGQRVDRGPVGRDVSGPTTDDAMTRSEEELDVGKRSRETGRARLRKHVVTEQVQTTVPVQREEVRVEREPITDANRDRATAGPDISEEEHEVTLHEDEVVVGKRTVPKERVRMDKETVTEQHGVSEEVRKERIEAEGDQTRRGR